MTSSVADHYANHLAPVYSWMVGDFEAACARADDFYSDIRLPGGKGSLAVDLGCGHGVHAVPLARRGYRVMAVDNSSHLLAELAKNAGELPIDAVDADLTDFRGHSGSVSPSVIVCMGDTLTHLSSINAVESLIRDCAAALAENGILAVSFRDYATHELQDSERFISVRSDDKRIHTCFLDYRPDAVIVHDILHTLVESSWRMSVSSYRKLRLHPDWLVSVAESQGLSLAHRIVDRGMIYFAFTRSAPARPE